MWPCKKYEFVVKNSNGGKLGFYHSKQDAEKAAAKFQAEYLKDKLNRNLKVFVEEDA